MGRNAPGVPGAKTWVFRGLPAHIAQLVRTILCSLAHFLRRQTETPNSSITLRLVCFPRQETLLSFLCQNAVATVDAHCFRGFSRRLLSHPRTRRRGQRPGSCEGGVGE